MKNNKPKSKLTVNKKVISNFEINQIKGGIISLWQRCHTLVKCDHH